MTLRVSQYSFGNVTFIKMTHWDFKVLTVVNNDQIGMKTPFLKMINISTPNFNSKQPIWHFFQYL